MKKISLSVLAILFAATSLMATVKVPVKKRKLNMLLVPVVRKVRNAPKQPAKIRRHVVNKVP